MSETFVSSLGVKQGCVLSTTLLKLYLTDLSDNLAQIPLTQNEQIEFSGVSVSHLLCLMTWFHLQGAKNVCINILRLHDCFYN